MENSLTTPLADTQLPAVPPEPAPTPSRWGRWLLAAVLFGAFFAAQVIVAIPFVGWMIVTNTDDTEIDLVSDPAIIWATLIGAAVAGAAVVGTVWAWPRLWSFFTGQPQATHEEWIAWATPRRIPMWLVASMTLPLVFVVTAGVQVAVGPSEVEAQQALFTTPIRQAVAAIVVSVFAPFAEELIFRGALYSALLPRRAGGALRWSDHIAPIIVTSVLFSLVHGLAGFTTLAPFVAVGGLALYLGLLRAITGSVQPSIVGHLTWNLIGSVFLILSHYYPGLFETL